MYAIYSVVCLNLFVKYKNFVVNLVLFANFLFFASSSFIVIPYISHSFLT